MADVAFYLLLRILQRLNTQRHKLYVGSHINQQKLCYCDLNFLQWSLLYISSNEHLFNGLSRLRTQKREKYLFSQGSAQALYIYNVLFPFRLDLRHIRYLYKCDTHPLLYFSPDILIPFLSKRN